MPTTDGTRYPKIYAVDFDGTLCERAWPDIGAPKWRVIDLVKMLHRQGDKIILWTNRSGESLENALGWCRERGLEFDAVNANLPEEIERWNSDPRKIGADAYIDDKAVNAQDVEYRRGGEAEWMEDGEGIYYCSTCGMPCGWSHPSLRIQYRDRWCSSCGARMKNPDESNRTPREAVRANWIRKEPKAHQYFCEVCGAKQSYPSVWCPQCGTHMDKDAWEKRWGVVEAWKKEPETVWLIPAERNGSNERDQVQREE